MKDLWRSYGRKFDALSMRERVAVFAAAVFVVVFVGYQFILAAQVAKGRQLNAAILQNEAQTLSAQQQSQALMRSLAQDPNEALRAQIADVRARIEERDNTVRGVQKNLVPPTRMASALEAMFNRSQSVRLVAMKTLPVSTLVEHSEPKEGEAPAPAEQNEHQIYKHGVEITLEGSYLDLLDYLGRMEKLPWQMFWASSRMDASDYPKVRVTLTLFTLSLDKAWLVV